MCTSGMELRLSREHRASALVNDRMTTVRVLLVLFLKKYQGATGNLFPYTDCKNFPSRLGAADQGGEVP